jgi:hypothetical protein
LAVSDYPMGCEWFLACPRTLLPLVCRWKFSSGILTAINLFFAYSDT